MSRESFNEYYTRVISEVSKKPITSKLRKGDDVKNVNPDCKHYKSEGEVEKVEDLPEVSDGKGGDNMPGKVVVYKDKKTGKKLKKTGEQLDRA